MTGANFKLKPSIWVLFVFFLYSSTGCKKDRITSDPTAKLEFSVDTVVFDTVFTTVGSTTRRVKVFNRGKQAVNIAEIKLFGGASSNYQLNINGIATHQLHNIELAGNDSLNLFVKITINPNSNLLPFIVEDSIAFLTNGNQQKIVLRAYGQNAVFLNNAVINANTVWDKTLPYVVYNSVTVNEGKTLTIKKGSRIYFHKDAQLIVGGTLKVEGEYKDSISFTSDRLEQIYNEEAGQWKGLHFLRSSKDNLINYALVKNATIGIQVDSLSETSNPKLLLANSMIYNMALVGLYGANADVAGFNNVIANCGKHLIYGIGGGRYNFKHNTFSALSTQFARLTPALYFTDKASSGAASPFNLTLINNIIWGTLQNELLVERSGNLPFNQLIRKNLIKSKDTNLETADNLLNADPLFKNVKQNNYQLMSASPAANKGEDLSADSYFNTWLNNDLEKKLRLFPSDLGCYELL